MTTNLYLISLCFILIFFEITKKKKIFKIKLKFYVTSAAGFPPTDIHSNSISRSSVVTIKSPWIIFGGSGGTKIVSVAKRDRIPGSAVKIII